MEWVIDLVLIAACSLTFYFRREPRPAWAPPVAIACIVVAGFVFLMEVANPGKPSEKPPPALAEVRTAFKTSAVTATSDVGYRADGFSVNIPEGYRYARLQEPMMLLASRGDHASTIAILRHELVSDDPEALVRQTLELMKKGNKTYEFSLLAGGPSQLRTWFRVTKNGLPLRGLLVCEARRGKLWQLTLTGPATGDDETLYRIAQTWRVD